MYHNAVLNKYVVPLTGTCPLPTRYGRGVDGALTIQTHTHTVVTTRPAHSSATHPLCAQALPYWSPRRAAPTLTRPADLQPPSALIPAVSLRPFTVITLQTLCQSETSFSLFGQSWVWLLYFTTTRECGGL